MATLEMVEKLRQRANVSYDEARAALDACGDDLLDALIYLERQGKVPPPAGEGRYSTRENAAMVPGAPQSGPGGAPHATLGDLVRRFVGWLRGLIHKGNTNSFEVWQEEKCQISVPVTVFVVLALCCFWVVLPLLVIGLFFGCNYRFRGPNLENNPVNNVMDSAAKVVDDIKAGVSGGDHTDHNNSGNSDSQ